MADIVIEKGSNLANVEYRLVPNKMAAESERGDKYVAQVCVKETYCLDDVAKRMVAEGCAVKASTIRLVVDEFAQMVAQLVAEGRAVNVNGLVRFAPAIRGTFAEADSAWDAAKNAVVVNASVGSRMRGAASASAVLRVHDVTLPELTAVLDLASLEADRISSRANFLVTGTRLEWDREAEDEGFFLSYEGNVMACTFVNVTTDGRVILANPHTFLSDGHQVELFLRSRLGGETLYQVKYGEPLLTKTAAE